jgi:hypothetical protein
MNTATVATTSGVLSVQNSGVPQNLGGILSALGKSTPPLGSAGPQTANGASRSSASTTTTTTSDLLTSDHVVVGEVMVDHQWKRVALGKPLTDSVVVVKALSYRDAALAVVKIRQTDATGFALRLQPRDERSRSHVSETVGYLVIERGCFRLADGTSLETRTVDTDPEYPVYSIAFSQAFRGVLMVMTGLTNTQEPVAVTGRPTLISEKGLQFQLQPQGPSPGLGALQTVSYVAWELSMAPLTASPSRSTRRSASHGGSFLPSYSRKSLLMPRCFSRISSAVKEVAQSM